MDNLDLQALIGKKFRLVGKAGDLSTWEDEVVNVFHINNSGYTLKGENQWFAYESIQINIKGKKNGFVYTLDEVAFLNNLPDKK